MVSEIEYAREKLERRKLQRAQVRKEKAMSASSNNASTESYGRAYIEKFMKEMEREQAFVQAKIKEALKAEEDEKNEIEQSKQQQNDLLSGILSSDKASSRKKDKSLDRKPGRVNVLNIAGDDEMFNHGLIVEKTVKMSDKSCMTDWKMFESYLREEFMDDFVDEEGNEKSMDIKVISGVLLTLLCSKFEVFSFLLSCFKANVTFVLSMMMMMTVSTRFNGEYVKVWISTGTVGN